MHAALEQGVAKVEQDDCDIEAEEPAPARDQIILKAAIAAQVGRKQDRANEVDGDRIDDDEAVEPEGPLRPLGEAEFVPPPQHRIFEYISGPDEVHPVCAKPLRMLDDA